MNETFIENQIIERVSFAAQKLGKTEYESCTFKSCDFSNADLNAVKFCNCVFEHCNFSMTKVMGTHFQKVNFKNSKVLGVLFDKCSQFLLELRFENTILDHSSFCNLKLKKLYFGGCRMQGTDFTGAEIPESIFDNCDLLDTVFSETNLEKCDFRSAYNYIIDPEKNKLKACKFSLNGVSGLLTKYKLTIES